MKSLRHPKTNLDIGKPPGWDSTEIDCDSLAVVTGDFADQPCIRSYWRPDEAELKRLNEGGAVQLHVLAYRMVPVMLDVVSAFELVADPLANLRGKT